VVCRYRNSHSLAFLVWQIVNDKFRNRYYQAIWNDVNLFSEKDGIKFATARAAAKSFITRKKGSRVTMKRSVVSAVGLLGLVVLLAGCSGVREHVRQYDFRTMRRAAAREKAVPSPVADVLDMNGWTSDFDGATAFARVNGQRTVVLFYGSDRESSKAKGLVEKAAARLTNVQRVALNFEKKRGIATRLGVSQAPAVVVLNQSGRVVAREEGKLTKDRVASTLSQ
jgi:hypothetical protein